MPLPLETKPMEPNAVYVPMILITTGISGGALASSCQLHFAAARVNDKGEWTPTGQSGMIHLNLTSLDADVAELAPEIADVYERILAIVGKVNKTKRVL